MLPSSGTSLLNIFPNRQTWNSGEYHIFHVNECEFLTVQFNILTLFRAPSVLPSSDSMSQHLGSKFVLPSSGDSTSNIRPRSVLPFSGRLKVFISRFPLKFIIPRCPLKNMYLDLPLKVILPVIIHCLCRNQMHAKERSMMIDVHWLISKLSGSR